MGDPKSKFAHHATTLRNKFELEKRHNFEVVKILPLSPSKHSQKQRAGSKPMELEDIVKHMSNLPSYLERGKPIQDKALTFGVIDWGRLEKWQYHHHHKRGLVKSNQYSPSSSNSSLFSTDIASPLSSRGRSCSPARQKLHRVPPKSHFSASPKAIVTPNVKTFLGNLENFQDLKDATIDQSTEPKGVKMNLFHHQNIPESRSLAGIQSTSSLKGKMKIQDESMNEMGNFQDSSNGTRDLDSLRGHKNVVFMATDVSGDSQLSGKNSRNEAYFSRNHNSPSRSKTPDEKRSIVDLKTGKIATSKERSMSPLRRFSFSMSSATKKPESPPSSQYSTKDTLYVSDRANSSPLRRLLNPIFSSKATNSRQLVNTSPEESKIKARLDLGEDSHRKEKNESSSIKQALFKTDVKNGRPLFTFAVENNNDILAATMRSLSSSEKHEHNSWMYTFFTIQEVKKKYGGWLSQGTKGKGHGYVPNIAAQMKVSNPSVSNNNGEFVLFSVDPSQFDYQIVKPQEELAAIVVKLSRKVDEEDDQDRFETTVILPGGSHGVPSKGQPSPLIHRWRSGGVCDCGGWDMGCGLKTLTNEVQSCRRSNSSKVHMTELFFKGEVQKGRPLFSLSPLKEGIYSVEFNSTLSLLQAFSICISVVEFRKWPSPHHTQLISSVAKQVQDQPPVTYAPFPPLSPVQRV